MLHNLNALIKSCLVVLVPCFLLSCQSSKLDSIEQKALDQILVVAAIGDQLHLRDMSSNQDNAQELVLMDATEWKINERLENEFRKRLIENGKSTWSLKPLVKKEILSKFSSDQENTSYLEPRRKSALIEELARRYAGLGSRYLLLISSEKISKPFQFLREPAGIVCHQSTYLRKKHWIYISYRTTFWDLKNDKELASFVPSEPYKIETPESACDFYTDKNKKRAVRFKDRFLDLVDYSVLNTQSQMGWYDAL